MGVILNFILDSGGRVKEWVVDFAVIGSGPAGQKAAIQAAKLGKTVVVVDKGSDIGGASLNSGTIPSKSLREAILDLTDFYKRSFYGQIELARPISINDLNFRLSKVLQEMRKNLLKQFEKNKIELIKATAKFETTHTLSLFSEDNVFMGTVHFEKCLIATGSKPRNPIHVPFDDRRVLDSTRLLSIDHVPSTMIVLGGGIIGAEYATFFAALGSKVIVIDKRERLLPLLDREIGMHLQTALSSLGLKVIGGKDPEKIVKTDSKVQVTFKDGMKLEADTLLYALGREAQIDGLSVEILGIELTGGHIPVNALFQTSIPHIYAAGDVIGSPALASTSMEQGRLAARHAFGVKTHHFPEFYPIGIYTIPEISSCGYTEEQLQALGFKYEVGRAYYYEIAKNQIIGNDPGMFKILFHSDTLEILGVHIVGRQATELVHIGQIAMNFKARIDYFIDQLFNYPTYAEGYRIAALNGMNKMKRKD